VRVVRRALAAALLLYLLSDYGDAANPGVFFFGAEQLFVEGAVEQRGDDVVQLAAAVAPVAATREMLPLRREAAVGSRPVRAPVERRVVRRTVQAKARRAPTPAGG